MISVNKMPQTDNPVRRTEHPLSLRILSIPEIWLTNFQLWLGTKDHHYFLMYFYSLTL